MIDEAFVKKALQTIQQDISEKLTNDAL